LTVERYRQVKEQVQEKLRQAAEALGKAVEESALKAAVPAAIDRDALRTNPHFREAVRLIKEARELLPSSARVRLYEALAAAAGVPKAKGDEAALLALATSPKLLALIASSSEADRFRESVRTLIEEASKALDKRLSVRYIHKEAVRQAVERFKEVDEALALKPAELAKRLVNDPNAPEDEAKRALQELRRTVGPRGLGLELRTWLTGEYITPERGLAAEALEAALGYREELKKGNIKRAEELKRKAMQLAFDVERAVEARWKPIEEALERSKGEVKIPRYYEPPEVKKLFNALGESLGLAAQGKKGEALTRFKAEAESIAKELERAGGYKQAERVRKMAEKLEEVVKELKPLSNEQIEKLRADLALLRQAARTVASMEGDMRDAAEALKALGIKAKPGADPDKLYHEVERVAQVKLKDPASLLSGDERLAKAAEFLGMHGTAELIRKAAELKGSSLHEPFAEAVNAAAKAPPQEREEAFKRVFVAEAAKRGVSKDEAERLAGELAGLLGAFDERPRNPFIAFKLDLALYAATAYAKAKERLKELDGLLATSSADLISAGEFKRAVDEAVQRLEARAKALKDVEALARFADPKDAALARLLGMAETAELIEAARKAHDEGYGVAFARAVREALKAEPERRREVFITAFAKEAGVPRAEAEKYARGLGAAEEAKRLDEYASKFSESLKREVENVAMTIALFKGAKSRVALIAYLAQGNYDAAAEEAVRIQAMMEAAKRYGSELEVGKAEELRALARAASALEGLAKGELPATAAYLAKVAEAIDSPELKRAALSLAEAYAVREEARVRLGEDVHKELGRMVWRDLQRMLVEGPTTTHIVDALGPGLLSEVYQRYRPLFVPYGGELEDAYAHAGVNPVKAMAPLGFGKGYATRLKFKDYSDEGVHATLVHFYGGEGKAYRVLDVLHVELGTAAALWKMAKAAEDPALAKLLEAAARRREIEAFSFYVREGRAKKFAEERLEEARKEYRRLVKELEYKPPNGPSLAEELANKYGIRNLDWAVRNADRLLLTLAERGYLPLTEDMIRIAAARRLHERFAKLLSKPAPPQPAYALPLVNPDAAPLARAPARNAVEEAVPMAARALLAAVAVKIRAVVREEEEATRQLKAAVQALKGKAVWPVITAPEARELAERVNRGELAEQEALKRLKEIYEIKLRDVKAEAREVLKKFAEFSQPAMLALKEAADRLSRTDHAERFIYAAAMEAVKTAAPLKGHWRDRWDALPKEVKELVAEEAKRWAAERVLEKYGMRLEDAKKLGAGVAKAVEDALVRGDLGAVEAAVEEALLGEVRQAIEAHLIEWRPDVWHLADIVRRELRRMGVRAGKGADLARLAFKALSSVPEEAVEEYRRRGWRYVDPPWTAYLIGSKHAEEAIAAGWSVREVEVPELEDGVPKSWKHAYIAAPPGIDLDAVAHAILREVNEAEGGMAAIDPSEWPVPKEFIWHVLRANSPYEEGGQIIASVADTSLIEEPIAEFKKALPDPSKAAAAARELMERARRLRRAYALAEALAKAEPAALEYAAQKLQVSKEEAIGTYPGEVIRVYAIFKLADGFAEFLKAGAAGKPTREEAERIGKMEFLSALSSDKGALEAFERRFGDVQEFQNAWKALTAYYFTGMGSYAPKDEATALKALDLFNAYVHANIKYKEVFGEDAAVTQALRRLGERLKGIVDADEDGLRRLLPGELRGLADLVAKGNEEEAVRLTLRRIGERLMRPELGFLYAEPMDAILVMERSAKGLTEPGEGGVYKQGPTAMHIEGWRPPVAEGLRVNAEALFYKAFARAPEDTVEEYERAGWRARFPPYIVYAASEAEARRAEAEGWQVRRVGEMYFIAPQGLNLDAIESKIRGYVEGLGAYVLNPYEWPVPVKYLQALGYAVEEGARAYKRSEAMTQWITVYAAFKQGFSVEDLKRSVERAVEKESQMEGGGRPIVYALYELRQFKAVQEAVMNDPEAAAALRGKEGEEAVVYWLAYRLAKAGWSDVLSLPRELKEAFMEMRAEGAVKRKAERPKAERPSEEKPAEAEKPSERKAEEKPAKAEEKPAERKAGLQSVVPPGTPNPIAYLVERYDRVMDDDAAQMAMASIEESVKKNLSGLSSKEAAVVEGLYNAVLPKLIGLVASLSAIDHAKMALWEYVILERKNRDGEAIYSLIRDDFERAVDALKGMYGEMEAKHSVWNKLDALFSALTHYARVHYRAAMQALYAVEMPAAVGRRHLYRSLEAALPSFTSAYVFAEAEKAAEALNAVKRAAEGAYKVARGIYANAGITQQELAAKFAEALIRITAGREPHVARALVDEALKAGIPVQAEELYAWIDLMALAAAARENQ
jgi:hypothetical protein